MEFVGRLIEELDTRQGTNGFGEWKRTEFLFETVEMYPKKVVMSVSDGQLGRVAIFRQFLGKTVIVQFDIAAAMSQSNGKWYNNVNAFGIRAANPADEPQKQTDENPSFGMSGGRS